MCPRGRLLDYVATLVFWGTPILFSIVTASIYISGVYFIEALIPFMLLLNCGVVEKTLEGPLNCKEIQPVYPKRDQSWVFIERTDVEAETPILWPPDAKSWLTGKDPDAGKDWGQEEKGMTEDEMAGWHHWLDGREFEWTPGVGGGQGGLVCCSSWGCKESDTTEWLSWTELNPIHEGLTLLT